MIMTDTHIAEKKAKTLMDIHMNDLSLVSMDDIWAELCKRYDGIILVYVQDLDNKQEAMQGSYHGGKATAIGLSRYMEHLILNELTYNEDEE